MSSPQWKLNRNSGFTLMELLVVISIVAVLAALSMAITQKVRAKAYEANALSSLRQVATANVGYSTENNGDINYVHDQSDPKDGGSTGLGWVSNSFWGRLQPYLFSGTATNDQGQLGTDLKQGIARLFNTQNAQTMARTAISGSSISADKAGLPAPFSFNTNVAQYCWSSIVPLPKVSQCTDPSQCLYFTYGSYRFSETKGTAAYEPRPTNNKSAPIYYLDDHNALGAFLDGHVELVAPPIPARRLKFK